MAQSIVIGKSQASSPFGEVWLDNDQQWTPFPFKAARFEDNNAAVNHVVELKKQGAKAYTEPYTVMLKRVVDVGLEASLTPQ